MVSVISSRKVFAAVMGLGLALVLAATASAAPPPIVLDVRNGATNVVAVTGSTQVVTTELWAVVADGNSTADDLVKQVTASAYSSNGGIIFGNLTISRLYPFNSSYASSGTAADLDGDATAPAQTTYLDRDRGSTDSGTVTGWVYMPAFVLSDPGDEGSDLIPGSAPSPAHMATLTFTGTGWVQGNPHGVTQIWLTAHSNPTASAWTRDGVDETGVPTMGTKVTLYRPATAEVGPTLTLGVATPTGNLGGTGSTGTIGTWEWVIGGITMSGLAGDTPGVSWEALVAAGLTPGATYGVTLNLGSDYETITPGTGFITLEATPEPATMALLAFGGLAMLARRRRSA